MLFVQTFSILVIVEFTYSVFSLIYINHKRDAAEHYYVHTLCHMYLSTIHAFREHLRARLPPRCAAPHPWGQ